ncbi:MAG: hypothetical protein FWE06_08535 [Oscillospiraceae bacterium]|nr:hypothetical protein [Oscillospiraceae bacterium]
MKKIILAILIIILLVALLSTGIWLVSRDGDNEVEPAPEPTYTETAQPTPTDEPTPTDTITPSEYAEALEILREEFGEGMTFTRRTDLDRFINEFRDYAFMVTFSTRGITRYLIAWVDTGYGWVFLDEEAVLYTLIPDPVFPMPMRDGEQIPYDIIVAFSIDENWVSYGFDDFSVMALYEAQLREAGFVDHGRVDGGTRRADAMWTLDDNDAGEQFIVFFDRGEEAGVSITMQIEPLS